MNFYKRYPADYGRKTARLTLAQHGAYTLLLDEIYSTEAPLPGPFDELYRICRAMSKPEQEAVRVIAELFFPLGDDGLRRNQRATEEITEAAPAIEAARLNGKKGGRPRKETQQKPTGFFEGNQDGTQTEPGTKAPHSSDNCSSLRSEQSCAKPSGYSVDFEQAWMAYPSRTGHSKAEAFKAWKARIADGEAVETILQGVNRYAAYCEANHTEPRFVKHAATFFGPDRHYLNDWTVQQRAAAPQAFQSANNTRYAAAAATIYDGVNL
ncbi:YdaU family protein [Acidovorax sp. K2F]|uniref:YdaU family protein n=1 Tax=Acidovorax sp. K2F TaxID=2978125 RepID=UPI0021B1163E|nr:YdaU family protein [Acidovorax sp. K2F]MCT6719453.1 YdaU family protein [Acidovorax sp. K2F]